MVETVPSEHDTTRSTPPARSLWFGLLGAPVAWLVHFLIMWAIAEGGCLAGWSRYGILGVDVITALLIVSTLVTLPVMLAAGYVAWHNWRQLRADAKDADGSADNYSLYMSRGGAILSVLFLALVILETVPALVLQPCLWTGPMS